MTSVATMPVVDQPTDRLKLVGWIVRDGISNEGMTFTQASDRWPMSLPTLNRLMSTGAVGQRFYRVAEKNLGLPHRLLSYVADGNVAEIRNLDGLEPSLRRMILAELGYRPDANGEPVRRTRRKS